MRDFLIFCFVCLVIFTLSTPLGLFPYIVTPVILFVVIFVYDVHVESLEYHVDYLEHHVDYLEQKIKDDVQLYQYLLLKLDERDVENSQVPDKHFL